MMLQGGLVQSQEIQTLHHSFFSIAENLIMMIGWLGSFLQKKAIKETQLLKVLGRRLRKFYICQNTG